MKLDGENNVSVGFADESKGGEKADFGFTPGCTWGGARVQRCCSLILTYKLYTQIAEMFVLQRVQMLDSLFDTLK